MQKKYIKWRQGESIQSRRIVGKRIKVNRNLEVRKGLIGKKRIRRSFSPFGARIIGYSSLSLLFLLGLGLLWPIVGLETEAADCTSASTPSSPECTMSTSVNTNLTTLIRSSIAVALSSRVELDVTPKSTGAFSASTANLKVTTNNTTGYAVYMQTADDSSELKATNPQVRERISPVTGVMTSEDYTSNLNQWGYAIGSTVSNDAEYRAVPKAGEAAIVKTEGISREDDYALSFAVAVGSDLPAGLYTNQLLVSVVANPIEVRSLNDITYMQEMTSEICSITFENETKQLIDTRDGKSYWVAKLKDGNCWMTQNLALTAPEGGRKLTPSDTDITEEWTLPETMTETGRWSDADDKAILSMNVDNGIGTYFTFHAATAQTEQIGDIVAGSVCPKGWRLPLAGTNYNNTNGSYYNLLNAYGLTEQTKSVAGNYNVTLPDGNTITSAITTEQYALTGEPLKIQRSGIVVATTGEISYEYASGQLWSSVKFGNEQTYALSYDGGGGVETSYNNVWFSLARFGKPVRCVAK